MFDFITGTLNRTGLLKHDLDYHFLRASMVIIFLFFGYQKWFEYEAQVLIPYISNGPLISWLYPVFGIRGACWFLGVMEWIICVLLFLGYWNKPAGILGAIGSCGTFVSTVTIIPFMPDGWDKVAGGFPAMTGNVPFLEKDVVLLVVSFYLLKQDVVRAMSAGTTNPLIKSLAQLMTNLGLLGYRFEYNLMRLSMVYIFACFGYTKWHQYAAEQMVPFISNSPFIFWLYPAFGFRGGSRFLGASEWTIFVLLFAGFWNKKIGIIGSIGSTIVFFTTFTIIPFMPNGWDPQAGFPAMAGAVPFLMKDLVLLVVSAYLVKQDALWLMAHGKPETAPELVTSSSAAFAKR
jgi:uncharacterized membrane protein YkgB